MAAHSNETDAAFDWWFDPARRRDESYAQWAEDDERRSSGHILARPFLWTSPLFMAFLLRRVSKPEARRVADLVSAWTLATEAIGHPVTAVEYAAYWGIGEATAYREFKSFRAAFPGEATPERVSWLIGWRDTPWIQVEEFGNVYEEVLGLSLKND